MLLVISSYSVSFLDFLFFFAFSLLTARCDFLTPRNTRGALTCPVASAARLFLFRTSPFRRAENWCAVLYARRVHRIDDSLGQSSSAGIFREFLVTRSHSVACLSFFSTLKAIASHTYKSFRLFYLFEIVEWRKVADEQGAISPPQFLRLQLFNFARSATACKLFAGPARLGTKVFFYVIVLGSNCVVGE